MIGNWFFEIKPRTCPELTNILNQVNLVSRSTFSSWSW